MSWVEVRARPSMAALWEPWYHGSSARIRSRLDTKSRGLGDRHKCCRVDRLTVHSHLEMQVCSSGETSRSGQADCLATTHDVANRQGRGL